MATETSEATREQSIEARDWLLKRVALVEDVEMKEWGRVVGDKVGGLRSRLTTKHLSAI